MKIPNKLAGVPVSNPDRSAAPPRENAVFSDGLSRRAQSKRSVQDLLTEPARSPREGPNGPGNRDRSGLSSTRESANSARRQDASRKDDAEGAEGESFRRVLREQRAGEPRGEAGQQIGSPSDPAAAPASTTNARFGGEASTSNGEVQNPEGLTPVDGDAAEARKVQGSARGGTRIDRTSGVQNAGTSSGDGSASQPAFGEVGTSSAEAQATSAEAAMVAAGAQRPRTAGEANGNAASKGDNDSTATADTSAVMAPREVTNGPARVTPKSTTDVDRRPTQNSTIDASQAALTKPATLPQMSVTGAARSERLTGGREAASDARASTSGHTAAGESMAFSPESAMFAGQFASEELGMAGPAQPAAMFASDSTASGKPATQTTRIDGPGIDINSQAARPNTAAAMKIVQDISGAMPLTGAALAGSVEPRRSEPSPGNARSEIWSLTGGGANTAANAASATKAGSKRGASSPAAPVEQQVAEALTAAMRHIPSPAGQRVVSIRLEPLDLGSVRVQLRVAGDTVSVKFAVGTQAAQQAVDRSLQDLRQSVERRGLRVASVSVELDASLAPAGEITRADRALDGADASGTGLAEGFGLEGDGVGSSSRAERAMAGDGWDGDRDSVDAEGGAFETLTLRLDQLA
ncbi:MAG: flagellar hook-length control protein FliK [Phycisphaerales bacterium]|nr:flagellar hook-length control protein FliK [Phycisphaerales bacterium]